MERIVYHFVALCNTLWVDRTHPRQGIKSLQAYYTATDKKALKKILA